MVLRNALPTDLDAIMTLEEAGFGPGIVEERAVFARRLAAFPEGFLVACEGDEVWGYLCAEVWSSWSWDDRARFDLGHDIERYLDTGGTVLYIASMTVAPHWRGGGRGRWLFRGALEGLRRAFPHLETAVLIVNEHWSSARSIYQGEGFHEVGRLTGFFVPEGEAPADAVVMERPWSPKTR